MKNQETSFPTPEGNGVRRSLVEGLKHAEGRYGGFCFGGQTPDGVTTVAPLPHGTIFPNGATAALLLTFDVEGTCSNGTGDMALEGAYYERICARLKAAGILVTFNIVGKMAVGRIGISVARLIRRRHPIDILPEHGRTNTA